MPVPTMMPRAAAPTRVAMDAHEDLCVDCLDDQVDLLAHQVEIALEVPDEEFAAFVADIDDDTEDLEAAYPAVTWRMTPLGQLRRVCDLHAAMHDEAAADDNDSELLALAEAIGVFG